MHTPDTGRRLLRLAGGLLLGGFLFFAAVTMAFHPKHDENNHPVIFDKYDHSDARVAIHIAQFVGVLIALGGFLVLHRFLETRGKDILLARLAFGATIATAAVWAALQAVDGTALKETVEAWAAASGPEKAARLNLYLQQVLGYGAFEGGAALLPMTGAIMLLMIVVAPRVVNRFGFKTPIVIGMLLLATGIAILSLVRPDGSFAVDVLPASLIAAAGMALAFIPSLGTAIASARPEAGGLASGIVNTSYQVGSALGLAAMTALATAQGADQIGDAAR